TAIYRLPLFWSAVATLPFAAIEQAFLVASWRNGALSTGVLAVESTLLWSAEGFGLITCVLSEAQARISFAQRATIERQRTELAEERAKSDRLLLNVLPADVARRLREKNETIAEGFDDVTIVFADLVGFTPLASRLEPRVIVDLLSRLFSSFDDLAEA